RSLVRRNRNGFDAYQIAGGYGELPTKKGRLTAPTNCWKIVVLIPRGSDPATISEKTRIIAVDMPNIEGIEGRHWQSFSTSVRSIEDKTGYDLFSLLPKDLQDRLETRIEIKSH
ncbi:MAG: DNA/RNA non-specific endonuclease, partial [Acidobacteria bacterium]|nr:DNA/RNA non-specific endonuclease [Acidobacteriota bacterium]